MTRLAPDFYAAVFMLGSTFGISGWHYGSGSWQWSVYFAVVGIVSVAWLRAIVRREAVR